MKDGRHWPVIIIGTLMVNFIAVGTLMYLSGSDGAHVVVEDDYYQRAVTHDDTMAQQRENLRLGWTASVSLTASPGASDSQVTVKLADRGGAAVAGATVAVTVYHRARAAERTRLTLPERVAGTYATAIRSTRRGLWHVNLVVERGAQRFTLETVADLGNTGAHVEGERR